MYLFGILFGLLAALLQSVAYIFSRVFVLRRSQPVISLMITSHIIMGVGAAALLAYMRPHDVPTLTTLLPTLCGVSGFYMAGQVGLFFVMRHTEASRVAPLLGFKIVFLSLISVLFFDRVLEWQHWIAVVLCVISAVALNYSGRGIPALGVLGLCCVCVGYSLSDLYIERLVSLMGLDSTLRASIIGMSMSFMLCGTVAICAYPFVHRCVARGDWLYALPYSIGWFLGMVCLFICFGYVGAVYGNILQASRGIMSVVMGAGLARLGLVHLEQRVAAHVMIRRLLAAILMVFAIWLFGR